MRKDFSEIVSNFRNAYGVGTVFYSICTGVSKSGMSATYRFFVVRNGGIEEATGRLATLLGKKWQEKGIRVKGCGFNRPLHVVSCAASEVYGWDAGVVAENYYDCVAM